MRASVRRHPVLALSLALASLSASACAKEDPTVPAKNYAEYMAIEYCEAVYSCPCDDYPYASANECYGDLLAEYNGVLNQAAVAGLAYDGSCPQQELEAINALECKGYVPPPPAGICIPPCNAFHGSLGAGFACQNVSTSAELGLAYSNCAQGLSCVSGVCADPCQASQALPALGEPCPDLMCESGAMCDPESGVCVAEQTLPGAGEPCVNGACDPLTAVCVVAANTCAVLPGIGQACVEGQCDPTGYCDVESEVCIAKPPIACGLLSGGGPGPGDGDGDPTGDGDGDGDGDPTGDGDGDPTGNPDCLAEPLPQELPVLQAGVTSGANYGGSCGGSGDEAVFSFVAPFDGSYEINTDGSAFDTVLYVHEGQCSGNELACDDDSLGGVGLSSVELLLATGQEITIFVDSFESGGAYILNIDTIE